MIFSDVLARAYRTYRTERGGGDGTKKYILLLFYYFGIAYTTHAQTTGGTVDRMIHNARLTVESQL